MLKFHRRRCANSVANRNLQLGFGVSCLFLLFHFAFFNPVGFIEKSSDFLLLSFKSWCFISNLRLGQDGCVKFLILKYQ